MNNSSNSNSENKIETKIAAIRQRDGKNQLFILLMVLSILGNIKVEVITPNLQVRVATQQNLMHKALRHLNEFMQ